MSSKSLKRIYKHADLRYMVDAMRECLGKKPLYEGNKLKTEDIRFNVTWDDHKEWVRRGQS